MVTLTEYLLYEHLDSVGDTENFEEMRVMLTLAEHIIKVDEIVATLEKSGQISLLWNGVGSQKPVLKFFRPRKWICELFAEESKFHDIAYCVGGGIVYRRAVDKEFCLRCNEKLYDLPWLRRLEATLWMRVDDDVLRNFGSYSWEERKIPCYDIEQLLKEAQ